MAQPPLTPNSMVALAAGDVELRPVVQILDVKQIGTNQNVQERYRLVLSDGTGIQQAMLATQLNDVVKSGRLVKGSIVRLQEYICNTVKERKIVIVLNLDILVTNAELVGEPKEGTDPASNIQQVPPPQQPQHQMPSMQHVPLPAQQFQPPPPQQPVQYQSSPRPQYQPAPQVAPAPASAPAPGPPPPAPAPAPFVQQQPSSYASSASYAGAPPTANSTYGRPISSSPFQQQTPASYTNRGPIARNEGPPGIIPIAALNPYHGRWTIKARVTSKTEIRRYNNARGDGKVFNFDLLDAEGGEIRVTCFNQACDKFYDLARVGQVYMVSKASLKAAAKAFNPLKNEWEIMFDKDSVLELVPEDSTVPQQVYDFKSISEIEALPNNAVVDVIGVVVAVNQTSTIMRKNGTETQRRLLQLKDMSGKMMEVTLWGNFCNREGQQLQEMFDSGQSPVLVIKGGRVSDFNGKTVGSISSSQFLIDPELPEVQSLHLWFEREGRTTPAQSISRDGIGSGGKTDIRKTISQIKDENLGRSDKADFISVRATIHFIKTDSFCYTACPLTLTDRKCHKKVTNNGDGTWRCERCDQTVPECEYRYMLSIQVMDHTGSTWLTAFQEPGEELMGVPAKDLFMWKQEENGRFLDYIASVQFTQHHFKLKVKEESYNDEQRVKLTVMKAERCDFATESKYLLEMIGKLQKGESVYQTMTSQAPNNGYGAASTSSYGTGGTAGYGTGTYGGYSAQPASNGYGGGNPVSSYGGASSQAGGFMNSAPPAYGASAARADSAYSGVGSYRGYGTGGGFDSGSGGYSGGGGGTGYGGGSGYNSGAGRGYGSGGGNCYKCGQPGHWSRDCTNQGAGRGSYNGF